MAKPILVTGATGKQGGALIRALLAHPSYSPTTHPIYAVTRNPSSSSATRLAGLSESISLIQGDLDDTPAIFSSLPTKPWGVFSVQPVGKNEASQGKALVDAAREAGVSHFVYTSTDRHGGDKPTDIPHFASKHEVEQYLIQKCRESSGQTSYTILRPVFFMENLEWGLIGKIICTAWRDHTGGRKLQVIATADIGNFAASAFMNPESSEYKNKGISLAGDELTFEEADQIFAKKTGQGIPVTYGFLASFTLWAIKDIGLMFQFFREEGFAADVGALRKMSEGLQDFGAWIDNSSYGKSRR